MPRSYTWTNKDGLRVGYGKHTADNSVPAVTTASGDVKTARVIIDVNDPFFPAVDTAFAAANVHPNAAIIKRGSRILSASLVVIEAFAASGGAGTISIGTYAAYTKQYTIADGTVDDADGIDATIAKTALDAVGASVKCDGALVGLTGTGVTTCGAVSASDVVIGAIQSTFVFQTGKAILTVEYIEPSMYGGGTQAGDNAPAFVE